MIVPLANYKELRLTTWYYAVDGEAYPQATGNEKRLARELAAKFALENLREYMRCASAQ